MELSFWIDRNMAAFLAILRCCFDLDELAMFPRPIKEYDWENTTIEKNDITGSEYTKKGKWDPSLLTSFANTLEELDSCATQYTCTWRVIGKHIFTFNNTIEQLTQLKLLKLGFFVGDNGFRIKSQQTVQEINVANCTEGVLEECVCPSSLKMVVCRQERFLAG